MPLYEYTCRDCEHAFETLVFAGDEVECPECHSPRLQRQWSVPARPRRGIFAADELQSQPASLRSRLPSSPFAGVTLVPIAPGLPGVGFPPASRGLCGVRIGC